MQYGLGINRPKSCTILLEVLHLTAQTFLSKQINQKNLLLSSANINRLQESFYFYFAMKDCL